MDANLQALRDRFEAKPNDIVAFDGLEEAHFVAGEWEELVSLYLRRLEAPDLDVAERPGPRARVILRLAQVLDERCGRTDDALARYQEAMQLDPTLRAAFAQVRRIYSEREQWALVLQVAEIEAELPMRPYERTAFHTELAQIWLEHLSDPAEAAKCFGHALEADAGHVPALIGLADAREFEGDRDAAVSALEHAAGQLRGTDRAAVWARLARMRRDQGADAATVNELFKRAATDDPRHAEALEALATHAETTEQWDMYGDLQERRFELADEMLDRLAIAHDAGRIQLERLRDPLGARHWFGRALDLFPDDPVVHLYLADVERLCGNNDALAGHLRRAADLADNAAPAEVLQESAQLATEQGDDEFAICLLYTSDAADDRY